MAEIQLVDVSRQIRFQMRDWYRCPRCGKNNGTENIHLSFKNYDVGTDKLWGTCEFCEADFQLQGKTIIRMAAIPAHSKCQCGRHFLFFNERDAQLVRFTKRLKAAYVRCPHCRLLAFLFTPDSPGRYWLSVGLQKLRIQIARQRRALRHALQGRA